MLLTGRECGTVVAVSGCIYWHVMVAVVSLGFTSGARQAERVQ